MTACLEHSASNLWPLGPCYRCSPHPPNNFLGVIGGISPLVEMFAYLNFRYLVVAFYQLGHSLRERLGALHQGIFQCFIIEYSSVRILHAVWVTSTPWNPFGRWAIEHMKKKLANVQEAMYSLVAPCKLLTVTSRYGASCIFYTDGSWLRVVRALLFIKWVWVDLAIRSQVRLVFSLLHWRALFTAL
jgi:hypothetical protein